MEPGNNSVWVILILEDAAVPPRHLLNLAVGPECITVHTRVFLYEDPECLTEYVHELAQRGLARFRQL